MSSTSLTRRSVFVAAPAGIVAATMPARAAGSHPDAALLALRDPYERTLAAAMAVSGPHDDAEDRYYAAKEAHPGLDRTTLEKMSGLDVAAARWEAALDLNSDVISQIVDTPAATIDGLAFKARICRRENIHHDLAVSILDDVLAIGGAHA